MSKTPDDKELFDFKQSQDIQTLYILMEDFLDAIKGKNHEGYDYASPQEVNALIGRIRDKLNKLEWL